MYKINTTHQFEKDLNRCIKRGYPMDDFREVIKLLERDGKLPANTAPTCFMVVVKVSGSVTSSQTGC